MFVLSTITRFTLRRTRVGVVLMSWLLTMVSATQVVAFAFIATSEQARLDFIRPLADNLSLKILYGSSNGLPLSTGAYVSWRTLQTVAVFAAIWAIIVSTRSLRGEEEAGRYELLLSGSTTAGRAVRDVLLGLGIGSIVMGAVVTLGIFFSGMLGGGQDIGFGESVLFGLAAISSAWLFLSIGALASQLFATRSQAVLASVVVLAVMYTVRAVADAVDSVAWLRSVTPLGWIENIRPLTENNALWLLPVVAVAAACFTCAIAVASRRDLGSSVLKDTSERQARTFGLGSFWGAELRFAVPGIAIWVASIAVAAALFCSLAKPASDVIASSPSLAHATSAMVNAAQSAGIKVFMGSIFLILLTITLVMVGAMVAGIRNQEAKGYADNYLVRQVSRSAWLGLRILMVIVAIVLVAAATGVAGWAGTYSQNIPVTFSDFMAAGFNMLPLALALLGVGVAAYGMAPRVAAPLVYAVVGWSFLVDLIGPSLQWSDWAMKTSIFSHVQIVPAVAVKWETIYVLLAIWLVGVVVGLVAFTHRDLISE